MSIFRTRTRLLMLAAVLLSVMCFMPSMAHAQDTTLVVHRDVAAQVLAVVDKLSEALAVPAKELFRVLTRQGVVEAWANLIWGIFWIVLVAGWWFRMGWLFKNKEGQWYGDPDELFGKTLFYCLGMVITLFMGVGAVFCFAAAIKYGLNPEYFAIQKILEALHPAAR